MPLLIDFVAAEATAIIIAALFIFLPMPIVLVGIQYCRASKIHKETQPVVDCFTSEEREDNAASV